MKYIVSCRSFPVDRETRLFSDSNQSCFQFPGREILNGNSTNVWAKRLNTSISNCGTTASVWVVDSFDQLIWDYFSLECSFVVLPNQNWHSIQCSQSMHYNVDAVIASYQFRSDMNVSPLYLTQPNPRLKLASSPNPIHHRKWSQVIRYGAFVAPTWICAIEMKLLLIN